MRHSARTRFTVAVLLLMGALFSPVAAQAQVMNDYKTIPPFINTAVPPNVLLLMDNSGSMNILAYKGAVAPATPWIPATPFNNATVYGGIFTPTECYNYTGGQFVPNTGTADPAIPGTCTSGLFRWSGNLLNYVTMRRIDIAKFAMTGGNCSAARDAAGKCTASLLGQTTAARIDGVSIPTASLTNLMPAGNIPGTSPAYFYLKVNGGLAGTFCVDNTAPNFPVGGPFQIAGPDNSCTNGDAFVETQYTIKAQVTVPAGGVLQDVGTRARFGLMEFDGDAQAGTVLAPIGSSIATVMTQIDNTGGSTWTPLSEALYEAGRYYAQLPPAFAGSYVVNPGGIGDPYWFDATWAGTLQAVRCCKSFVIIFTDGAPTQDESIPSALQDLAHTANAHGASPHCGSAQGCTRDAKLPAGVGAQPLHAVGHPALDHAALNDHHDNCSSYFGGPNADSCNSRGSHYLDDIAYWLHTTDIRQATVPNLGVAGQALVGTQNLTIYTFLAFGSGINILRDAAKMGGFEDRNASGTPDLPEEWDKINNDTGAAAPDGVPDTYFESNDAFAMRSRLEATITSLLSKSSSGTSVSVLASSSTGEGSLYQAYFYPSTTEGLNEIKWTGFTQGLFLDAYGNIREDRGGAGGTADGKLIYASSGTTVDNIMRTRYDSATGDVFVDRYKDDNGDGVADSTTAYESVSLKEIQGIWEAGKQLALRTASTRKLFTWTEPTAGTPVVIQFDYGSYVPLPVDNRTTLQPYLKAATTNEAADIIKYIRGESVTGYRPREIRIPTGTGPLTTWKLGDPIHSTPTFVGAPRERYDLIYGDGTYTPFYVKWKNRRSVVYEGANDGMLHAFNGGFYYPGDDPSTGSSALPVVEHGRYLTQRIAPDSAVTNTPALGEELWGFIPMQLLPQLKWLTDPAYSHSYYVDLKPKVTDVRMFCAGTGTVPPSCITGQANTDHVNGWGTIVIVGMRLGGSCTSCVAAQGAPKMSITDGTARDMLSSYFVLDITNPEEDPKLLWSFTDSTLGLTTGYPAIVRANSATDGKTSMTYESWFMVVGSGPVGYDYLPKNTSNTQTSRFYAWNLKTGVKEPTLATSAANSFMGNLLSVDVDLDYRVDSLYGGTVMCNTAASICDTGPAVPPTAPKWKGAMYRLTTQGCTGMAVCDSLPWGGVPHIPTVLTSTFSCTPSPCTGATLVGPTAAQPSATKDDSNKVWVFFGTGRYFDTLDKTNADVQHFIGIKDPVLSGSCTQTSATNCERNDLLNVTNAAVCIVCTGNEVTNVTGVTTFAGLIDKIKGTTPANAMDGWYMAMAAGERVVTPTTVVAGLVFFPSFTPVSDMCSDSGNSTLYALHYRTGSAPKEPVIGTTGTTNMVVNKSMSLGSGGVASQVSIQIGAQGSGSVGGGCSGRLTGYVQSSSGALTSFCISGTKPWSKYVSWVTDRT